MSRPWDKFWPKGVPKSIQYPEIPLTDFIENTANKFPDRAVTVFHETEMTYGRLWDIAMRFATALADIGVKKGDVVAIMLDNCPQFIAASFGALKIGAVVTPCSPMLASREFEHQLEDSTAKTAVLSYALYLQRLKKIRGEAEVENIITLDPLEYTKDEKARKPDPETIDFKSTVEKYEPNPPHVKIEPKKDLAVLGYTGGTTGTPKGVMLTHYNRVVNLIQGAAWYAPAIGEEADEVPIPSEIPREKVEKGIAVSPWCHAMGFAGLSTRLAVGTTMVIMDGFDPGKFLKLIETHKPHGMGGAPTLYRFLLSHPNFDKCDKSSLKYCISAAAPLPVETLREIEKRANVIVIEGYGLTEATAATIINPTHPESIRKVGSVGIPISDTDAKVVDVETGTKEVPTGEIGELILSGPQVMQGYWRKSEETAKVLRNGWLYTGDIAKMDGEGYFYIVERKKDMLIYKGYNVYPRELEEVLYEHPAVKLCAVVGKPDRLAGEIPKAFVVLKEGAKVTAEELMKFVEERVSAYKKIKEIEFRSSLPLTFIGKVSKKELRGKN
jgi:long-chain acyl-CoA synthetase